MATHRYGPVLMAVVVSWSLAQAVLAAPPLRPDVLSPEAANAVVAATVGPVAHDEQVQTVGRQVTDHATQPEGLDFEFAVVERPEAMAVALPNGSVYLSDGALQAIDRDVERVAFLCASEAALVLDGEVRRSDAVARAVRQAEAVAAHHRSLGPKTLPGAPGDDVLDAGLIAATEATLRPERVFAADRSAMLYMLRAGMPPLEAVRALEDLSLTGRTNLTVTSPAGQPSLVDRRIDAERSANDLIQAALAFDFGVMDLAAGNYRSAGRRFQQFLHVFPDNYAGWNNVGLCFYHLAVESLPPGPFLLADAIADFDTGFATRLQAQLNRRAWDSARTAYERALSLDPYGVEALSNFGNLYLVDDNLTEANRLYEAALAQRPAFAPALSNLGVAISQAQPAGDLPPAALARFEAAAQADPNLPEAQFNLGAARLELGRDDPAGPWQRYLRLAPGGPKAAQVHAYFNQTATAPADTGAAGDTAGRAETWLEVLERARLMLNEPDSELLAVLPGRPDVRRQDAASGAELWGWTDNGLVVELLGRRVNRVMAGRPSGFSARTPRGVEVGYTTDRVRREYGDPPAVSGQDPYDVWLYPKMGLGFLILGDNVEKLFLFAPAAASDLGTAPRRR